MGSKCFLVDNGIDFATTANRHNNYGFGGNWRIDNFMFVASWDVFCVLTIGSDGRKRRSSSINKLIVKLVLVLRHKQTARARSSEHISLLADWKLKVETGKGHTHAPDDAFRFPKPKFKTGNRFENVLKVFSFISNSFRNEIRLYRTRFDMAWVHRRRTWCSYCSSDARTCDV